MRLESPLFKSWGAHPTIKFPGRWDSITNRSVTGMPKGDGAQENNMKQIQTAIMTIAITLAVIAGTMGFAAAGSSMNYNVDFDGIGTGSVTIGTFTPIGSDFQNVDWTNCEAIGTQTGYYGNGGWMTIDRNTRIDTAQNGGNVTNPSIDVYGSIVTQSQLNTDGGVWTPGRVFTAMTLNDSKVYNDPEDYMELTQSADLYDGDFQTGGTAGYEKILADTSITARLFDNGGNSGTGFNAVVAVTTDATTNASSAASASLKEGEIFMDIDSRLIDDAANVESARTIFDMDVPNMPGYTEQNTGSFAAQAAINGILTDQMAATFVNVDNINTTGYFYAVTP